MPTNPPETPVRKVSMSNPERAAQIWHILIAAARQRQTLTYGLLSEITGAFPAGLGTVLGHIMRHCRKHSYPSLTTLVVQTSTGRPGDAFVDCTDFDAERERIYAFDWYAVRPPTPEELAANLP